MCGCAPLVKDEKTGESKAEYEQVGVVKPLSSFQLNFPFLAQQIRATDLQQPLSRNYPCTVANVNAADRKVLVVGTARNVAKRVEKSVHRLNQALSNIASSVQWFVVESDSSDGTVQVLERIAEAVPDFSFVSLGRLEDEIPERSIRLAFCRNRYLNELKHNPAFVGCNFLAVADLDGVNDQITAKGLASCFEQENWAACFANQRGPYYDIWALRHQLWSPNDCWEFASFLRKHGLSASASKYSAVTSRMVRIPENAPWIQVDSAFGGLGLYRVSSIKNSSYSGADPNGFARCEHVSFNRQIGAEGASLFINPALINGSWNLHSVWATRPGQLVKSILGLRPALL